MRYLLCAWLCLLAAPLLSLADGPTLKEARQRWLRGNYEEARSIYEELARDAKQKTPATIGLSNAFIINEVYANALKADKDFRPSEYQSGMLLLEKYSRGEALEAFDKALTINPNAAEALDGKGIAALQKFEIKDAEQFAEQALKIN